MLCANSDDKVSIQSDSGVCASNTPAVNSVSKVHNDSQVLVKAKPGTYVVKPEDFIWLELSLVDAVERVFVAREHSLFRVLTVVNERSPELRKRVHERERAIIDAHPQSEFDFHILARDNHHLHDVVDCADRPSYSRR
ncbi:MAG TPA: hypothetical protein VHW70_12800 [Edaphobacter sp.]|jgi:hypothetical protein|nr:hypothetical protein [Edaphobacter sp.]